MVKRGAGRISRIRKRTREVVPFRPVKIKNAILKAIKAVNQRPAIALGLTKDVVSLVNERFAGTIPNIEQIQDTVEEVLMRSPYDRVAKAYILYRRARTHAREIKQFFGIRDDLKLGVNAIKVLEERYLLRDEKGNIVETPTELFKRVAKAIAAVEKKDRKKWENAFFEMLKNLEFLPNSPTLMNAGTKLGQLAACFVLPIEDSLDSIFTTLKDMATIQQSGGGTGFSFSKLRHRGDVVKSTMGVASGPVSFMRVYDMTTNVIKQGGKRRGANMGILHCSHPDIGEFVVSKRGVGKLSNFNISVAATDRFISAALRNAGHSLISPRTGKPVARIKAKKLLDLIIESAWRTGDPGMIFIDEINRRNQTPAVGVIESTNPCGEQPLLAYESCNLGSINLAKMLKSKRGGLAIDWTKLRARVGTAVRFLDNVIDANRFPIKQVELMTKANRKIGLGIMGFADALIQLGIPYNSAKALALAEKIMIFISNEARRQSVALGREKGSFPNFGKSVWKGKLKALRNAALTTIAPTGSISIIAGCSSGIEPLFAIAFIREVMEGKRLMEVNSLFQTAAIKAGFYSDSLIREIARKGTVQSIKGVPRREQELFVTALDIAPEWHVKIQSAFQRYVDNAVSKTVNLPKKAKIADVKKVYLLAHKLKCKGITVYRYGSKPEQVLYLGTAGRFTRADLTYSGGCPAAYCMF